MIVIQKAIIFFLFSRRAPVTRINHNMRRNNSTNKVAAKRKMQRSIDSSFRQKVRSAQQPQQTVIQENQNALPFIQSWISYENKVRCATNGPKRHDLMVLRLMDQDVTWLDGVYQELVQIVPCGHMSPAMCCLTQALIRAMTQHKSTHSRTMVDDFFTRLIQEEDKSTKPLVTAVLYGVVTRHFKDPLQAANLLELMRDRHVADPKKCARPMKSNLTSVLYCWTKSDLPQAPHMAHNLLRMMSKPNLAMYNTVLHAYYRHKMPEEADALLAKLQREGVKVNAHSFLLCIMAWETNATRAMDVMERLCLVPELRPTTLCFAAVMQAIYKSTIDPGPMVADWLHRLLIYKMNLPEELKSHTDFAVGQAVYQLVMKSWEKSKQPEEVKEVIDEMRSRGMTPNAACWTILVQAWCSKDVEQAEKVVQNLDKDKDLVQPTATMCHFVLEGWNKKGSPERCQAFFDWMCEFNVHPDASSFKLVFVGWNNGKGKKDAGKHVLQMLRRLENYENIKPDMGLYELALGTLACTHKRKVLKFLNRLESMHQKGIHVLSPQCYNLALSSSSGVKEVEEVFSRMKSIQCRPTTESFNYILLEWAKSASPDAVPTARTILKRMEAESVAPDSDTYNYILATCMTSKHDDATEIAKLTMVRFVDAYRSGDVSMVLSADMLLLISENARGRRKRTCAKIVQDMVSDIKDFPHKDFASSYYTYSLTVCSMSRDDDAPVIAQALWERMRRRNLRTFNLLLNTFACHALPVKAEHFLESVGTENTWAPDDESYDFVLEAWARSKQKNAAQRAYLLLEQRKKPTPRAFANVLLACALTPAVDSGTKLHQYNLAIRTFQHLGNAGHSPTSLHYYRLLLCAVHLAPDSTCRVGMATFIFRQCCRDGQVDQWILQRFWSVATNIVRKKLLDKDDDAITLSQLPHQWTCHRLCTC